MTKTKRIIALVAAALLCLSLCSCKELDQMRAAHAVWQEDGAILINGAVYRPLPDYGLHITDEYIDWTDYERVNVTEADVPVLLSAVYFDAGYWRNDGTILEVMVNDDSAFNYYCREDCYDAVVAELDQRLKDYQANSSIDTYYYTFESLDSQRTIRYQLTTEQRDAVDMVIESVAPIKQNEGIAIVHKIGLTACDEMGEDMGWFGCINRTVDDDYYLSDVYDQEGIYPVPEEMYPMFDSILMPIWENHEVDVSDWPVRNAE